MATICPTVTSEDLKLFNEQKKLAESLAARVHIDVMDGVFTATKSPELSEINITDDVTTDIHIMYQQPEQCLNTVLNMKPAPNLVIIHAESDTDIRLFASKLRASNIKTGLAVLPETTISSVEHLLPHVQQILIFGGKLGYHGGHADLSQLNKIEQVKQLVRNNIEFAWDGGANADNIPKLKDAGIDVINVGSAIHSQPDPVKAHKQLVALAK